VLQRLNSAVKLIQRTTPEAPHQRHCRCVKTFPGMKKHQDHSVRRPRGPAGHGLSDGGNSRDSFGLFRDWPPFADMFRLIYR
jgi:hypothetical protein